MAPPISIGIGIGVTRGGAASAPWAPSALAPTLWVRTDTATIIGGTAVDVLTDKSGNGNDLAAPLSTNRPAYTAADAKFAGQPSLRFSGATFPNNGVLRRAGSVFPAGDLSVIMIGAPVAGATAGGWLAETSGGGVLRLFWYSNGVANITRWNNGPARTATAGTAFCYAYTATGEGGASVETASLNGGVAATASGTRPALTNRDVNLGSTSSSGFPLSFDFAELILVSRVLTAGELASIVAYSRARYGTP